MSMIREDRRKSGIKPQRFMAGATKTRVPRTCVEWREEVQRKRKMTSGGTSKLGTWGTRAS